MKTDCFYVYRGQPVAIQMMFEDGTCEIRWIKDYECKDKMIVRFECLKELTEKFAVKAIELLTKKRDKEAAKYNNVIRNYIECMRYM